MSGTIYVNKWTGKRYELWERDAKTVTLKRLEDYPEKGARKGDLLTITESELRFNYKKEYADD